MSGHVALVCGSRTWTNRAEMWRLLDGYHGSHGIRLLVHGAARGADRMAGEWARENGVPVAEYPAQWARHGKAAGPIRNQQMLDEEHPEVVLAFAVDLTNSAGTRDMIRRAGDYSLPVLIVNLPRDDAE